MMRGRVRGSRLDQLTKDFGSSPPANATVGADVYTPVGGSTNPNPRSKTRGVTSETGKIASNMSKTTRRKMR